jgi:hypothetical protein
MTTCSPTESWTVCALKTKKAVMAAATPQMAFEAAADWTVRYRNLYNANVNPQWPASDQDMMEVLMESFFDDTVGKWLDPAAIAFSMALKKYLPRLAAAVGMLTSPIAIGFYVVLAPSPIANEFTEARLANEEIHRILRTKLDAALPAPWQTGYDEMMSRAYQKIKGNPLP